MPQPKTIWIRDPSGDQAQAITELSVWLAQAGIGTVSPSIPPCGLGLCLDAQGLRLIEARDGREETVRVDFGSDAFLYRLRHGGGRRQPLGRAVGLKPGHSPRVLDATAGLGRDAFILAALGCEVVLCERSAIIFALLEDGLQRAARDHRLSEIAGRLTLQAADSLQLMATLKAGEAPEVIYLDPMFPPRSKTALVKKEMRLVRAAAGDDDGDPAALLGLARNCAGRRVVCKRPATAPPLAGRPAPDFAITTPRHRFDVYLVNP
ncbi:MAG: class I SAM-dependent methyltransferase [Desulfobacteraceae bacterium]|nr:class I SAM-dependent methyltransferase [Desulfobacteraceae bacterium]